MQCYSARIILYFHSSNPGFKKQILSNTIFISLNLFSVNFTSQDTAEMSFSRKRQRFLVNQGYAYKVVTKLAGLENDKEMLYETKEHQVDSNLNFPQHLILFAKSSWNIIFIRFSDFFNVYNSILFKRVFAKVVKCYLETNKFQISV